MNIILCGGGDLAGGELKEIDSKALQSAKNKTILVLDLSTNDEGKRSKYRDFLRSYFEDLGSEDVLFMSELGNDNSTHWSKCGMVYLPGGNPITLLDNLIKHNVGEKLKQFQGVVLGNSAGALVLSKHMIATKDDDFPETIVKEGLGLVPFSVEVHYTNSKEEELAGLGLVEDIYCIPENSSISVSLGKIEFSGHVKKLRN